MSGIDQRRRRRVEDPPASGRIASAAALEMVIAAARIDQERILRQGMPFLPGGKRPGGHRGVHGRARGRRGTRLQCADGRIRLRDVQAVVVALESHGRCICQHVQAIRPGPDHAEHVVGGADVSVVQIDSVAVGPQHAGSHVHGTEPQGAELDSRVLVSSQDRMRQIEVRGSPLDGNAVMAPLHGQPIAADEIALVHEQTVGSAGNRQMAETNAIGFVQMEGGRLGTRQKITGAPGRHVRAAHHVDLFVWILLDAAGVEFPEGGRRRRLVESGVHVDHVARLQIVGVDDFGNPTLGRQRGRTGVGGAPDGIGIHVPRAGFVVHVVVDRAVLQYEVELAGGADGGIGLVHHSPQSQRRRG